MSLTVDIIGQGHHADVRRQAVEAWAGRAAVEQLRPEAPSGGAVPPPPADHWRGVDVAFVAVPTADHYRIAEAATKHGVHVFLEWPPATSLRECRSIVQLAEEAGVEVGVSRPLRYHALFDALGDARVQLITLRHEVGRDTLAFWPPRCAEALDLCCALAQSHGVDRIDAEAVPRNVAWPEALAFALRFQSGTYAQVSLARRARPAGYTGAVVGPRIQLEADLAADAVYQEGRRAKAPDDRSLVERETAAFLEAIAQGRVPPVTVLDGLHTMRLAERLMARLR